MLRVQLRIDLIKDEVRCSGEARHSVRNHQHLIVLRRSESLSAGLTLSERFTVAHELGHLLLDSHLGVVPINRRDYWETEELCDWFAGKLLVPDECLMSFTPRNAAEALHSALLLAHRLKVSRQVMAARITERSRTIVFCGGTFKINAGGQQVLKINWVFPRHNTIGIKLNQHLTTDTPLANFVGQLGSDHEECARIHYGVQLDAGTVAVKQGRWENFIALHLGNRNLSAGIVSQ